MAHDIVGKMMSEGKKGNKFKDMEEVEDNGKGKIESIHIRVVDNGYVYNVMTDKMKGEDYVYEDMSNVVEALKDDLGSPHIRKSHKGLSAMKARKILHDTEVRGNSLTKKQRGYFGTVAGK